MASSWRRPRREDNYDDEDDNYDEEDYGEEEEEDDEDDDYEEQEGDEEGTEEGTTGENSPTPYSMELHSMTAKVRLSSISLTPFRAARSASLIN